MAYKFLCGALLATIVTSMVAPRSLAADELPPTSLNEAMSKSVAEAITTLSRETATLQVKLRADEIRLEKLSPAERKLAVANVTHMKKRLRCLRNIHGFLDSYKDLKLGLDFVKSPMATLAKELAELSTTSSAKSIMAKLPKQAAKIVGRVASIFLIALDIFDATEVGDGTPKLSRMLSRSGTIEERKKLAAQMILTSELSSYERVAILYGLEAINLKPWSMSVVADKTLRRDHGRAVEEILNGTRFRIAGDFVVRTKSSDVVLATGDGESTFTVLEAGKAKSYPKRSNKLKKLGSALYLRVVLDNLVYVAEFSSLRAVTSEVGQASDRIGWTGSTSRVRIYLVPAKNKAFLRPADKPILLADVRG